MHLRSRETATVEALGGQSSSADRRVRYGWCQTAQVVNLLVLGLVIAFGMIAWPARHPPAGGEGPLASLACGGLDLQRAAWYELAQLPGIGEGLARRMVEYRDRLPEPIEVSDLRGVKGIGVKTLQRIGPLLSGPQATRRPGEG
jgi:hypothetical protein